MKLDDLLREADGIIEKKASKNEPKIQPSNSYDEVTKLASLLLEEDEVINEGLNKQASAVVAPVVENDFQMKLASALMITEVLNNIDKFEKIAAFEQKALAAGHSQMEVDKFIVEKFV